MIVRSQPTVTVGADIVQVQRFLAMRPDSRLAANLFTPQEMNECQQKQNPAESLAARFAAKEAIRKSLKKTVPFNAIDIGNAPDGSPTVRFLDPQLEQLYAVNLSLSHTETMAMALCLTTHR